MKTFILACLLAVTAVSATAVVSDPADAAAPRGGRVAGNMGKR